MKTAIIIHGMPTKEEYDLAPGRTHGHWYQWLARELEQNNIATVVPEMPTPYAPVYSVWCKTFEQIGFNEETVLVGHSCGAGFLLRYLSQHEVKVGKVVLVAPWIDPVHEERELVTDFFDFTIDTSLVSKTDGITVFIAEDDDIAMLKTVEVLEKEIRDIHIIRRETGGHFTEGDGFLQFPELLEEIL